MYDSVYECMVEANVAKKNATESLYDIEGNPVNEDSDQRLGLGTAYELTQPEWILLVRLWVGRMMIGSLS